MKANSDEKRWAKLVMLANVGLVVLGGLGLIGGFYAFTDGKFATKESVQDLKDDVKEMKQDIKTLLRNSQ